MALASASVRPPAQSLGRRAPVARGRPSPRGRRRPRPTNSEARLRRSMHTSMPGSPPVVVGVADQHHRGGIASGYAHPAQATAGPGGSPEARASGRWRRPNAVVSAPESTSALMASSPKRVRVGDEPGVGALDHHPVDAGGVAELVEGRAGHQPVAVGPGHGHRDAALGDGAAPRGTRSARRMNSPVRNIPSGLCIRLGMKSSSRVGQQTEQLAGECNRSVLEVATPVPHRALDHGADLVGEERPGRAADGVGQQERRHPLGLWMDERGGHAARRRSGRPPGPPRSTRPRRGSAPPRRRSRRRSAVRRRARGCRRTRAGRGRRPGTRPRPMASMGRR